MRSKPPKRKKGGQIERNTDPQPPFYIAVVNRLNGQKRRDKQTGV